MCGVVGFYSMGGVPADSSVLARMMLAQRHRGPDDQGARLFSLRHRSSVATMNPAPLPVPHELEGALGFNRLSILDLSANGHQPMVNRDGSIFVAFNGEIYNAFDYRSELEAAGYAFRSNTDTEVLLYLYESYGLDGMLERLNGMFAMAIVDLREQAMFLVRDRLGIKPLYMWARHGTLLFASEIKSFLPHPEFEPTLDEEGLDEYVAFRGRVGAGTLFRDVRELRPGHYIRVGPVGFEERRYWSLPSPRTTTSRSLDQSATELREGLERSVQRRLISDVQLGCQLSGGVDSSLVNVVAADLVGSQIDAISVILDPPELSEERWMDRVAQAGQIAIHKHQLTPERVAERFSLATWHMDEPLHVPNAIGIFFLAENAKRDVTVLLSGEGADELLGGYQRFYHAAVRHRLLPLLPVIQLLPWAPRKLRRLRDLWGDRDAIDSFIFGPAQVSPALARSLRPSIQYGEMLAARREIFSEELRTSRDFLAACIGYELRTHLVQLLVRQDKMTMAHSVENRVPFLDHEFVELARSLPSSHLVRGRPLLRNASRSTKLVLKRVAAQRFGADFAYRQKMGFEIPLGAYYRESSLRGHIQEELLPGIRTRGILNAGAVDQLWLRVLEGDKEAEQPLWTCIALEEWARLFLDRRGPPGPLPVGVDGPSGEVPA